MWCFHSHGFLPRDDPSRRRMTPESEIGFYTFDTNRPVLSKTRTVVAKPQYLREIIDFLNVLVMRRLRLNKYRIKI